MIRKINKFLLLTIIIISLITPFIYSFTFFNGFAGQIKPTDYPQDWNEINSLLNEDKQDFKILFFPWHGYMDFKWVNNTDKRIANPAKNFFDKEVISGTNVEIEGIYRQDNAPDQLYIDNLLEKRKEIKNFGELVSILNVKYILLTKESDYNRYKFLFNQTDLELIKETNYLYVFKNKNDVMKIYQTNDIDRPEKIGVSYEKMNPVRYKLGEVNKKYIVFTEPYSEDWKLDGKGPIKTRGVVNAFENGVNAFENGVNAFENGVNAFENGGKEIRFERFYRINLPSYIISLLTFIGLIILYFDLHKKI